MGKQSQIYSATKTELSDHKETESTRPGISSAIKRGSGDVLHLCSCEGPDLLITVQQHMVWAAKGETKLSYFIIPSTYYLYVL